MPLGSALDGIGPRRVLLGLLGAAVIGCMAFAQAQRFLALTLARADRRRRERVPNGAFD